LEKQTLGFIGLGTMGRPVAANLLNAGYPLRVYNRTRAKADPVIAAGAEWAESPAGAARGADVVITMLSDSPVVRDAMTGSDGVLAGAEKGAVVIDMSTISPAVAVEIASECERAGVSFLDAPVSGGESGAVAGTLSIMVGGPKEALELVRPILEVVGSRITYMGGSGKGQTAKLCNQVVCGLTILAACEGLALGLASELDLTTLLEAIGGGAAGSWMLSNLAPKMVARDWAPGFRVALQQKDLRLALEWAAQNKLPLVGTAAVHQLFRVAEAAGGSDEGTQALFKAVCALGSVG
jgi:3-hydroxyisobutyrate dehydrogenase